MPWVLIHGALRRLRRAMQMDRREAAKRVGLSELTIHRHETPELAPRTLQAETVRRYQAAYRCKPEAFAQWQDRDSPAVGLVAVKGHHSATSIGARASREAPGGMCKTIATSSGMVEIVSNQTLNACMTAWALYEGRQYAVAGTVTEMAPIPNGAAHALGTKTGAGARFRIDRHVLRGLPVRATVFTRDAEHTRCLIAHHQQRQPVVTLVRVFVPSPENGDVGFLIFEKNPVAHAWIFVVDDIIASMDTTT